MDYKRILNNLLKFSAFIIIFIAIFVLLGFYSAKSLVNRKNMGEYVKSADILNIKANIIFKVEDDITIKEKIYEMGLNNNIPKEILDDIVNSKEINILLGEYFNKVLYYLTNNIEKPEIGKEVIENIFLISKNSLDNHINIMMDEDTLEKNIISFCYDLSKMIPVRQNIFSTNLFLLLKDALNFKSYYVYILLLILYLLLYIFTKKIYKPIKYFALAILMLGFIFVLIGSFNNEIINFILENVEGINVFMEPLLIIYLTICLKIGVVSGFLGIFLLIFYIIINRININKELFYK